MDAASNTIAAVVPQTTAASDTFPGKVVPIVFASLDQGCSMFVAMSENQASRTPVVKQRP